MGNLKGFLGVILAILVYVNATVLENQTTDEEENKSHLITKSPYKNITDSEKELDEATSTKSTNATTSSKIIAKSSTPILLPDYQDSTKTESIKSTISPKTTNKSFVENSMFSVVSSQFPGVALSKIKPPALTDDSSATITTIFPQASSTIAEKKSRVLNKSEQPSNFPVKTSAESSTADDYNRARTNATRTTNLASIPEVTNGFSTAVPIESTSHKRNDSEATTFSIHNTTESRVSARSQPTMISSTLTTRKPTSNANGTTANYEISTSNATTNGNITKTLSQSTNATEDSTLSMIPVGTILNNSTTPSTKIGFGTSPINNTFNNPTTKKSSTALIDLTIKPSTTMEPNVIITEATTPSFVGNRSTSTRIKISPTNSSSNWNTNVPSITTTSSTVFMSTAKTRDYSNGTNKPAKMTAPSSTLNSTISSNSSSTSSNLNATTTTAPSETTSTPITTKLTTTTMTPSTTDSLLITTTLTTTSTTPSTTDSLPISTRLATMTKTPSTTASPPVRTNLTTTIQSKTSNTAVSISTSQTTNNPTSTHEPKANGTESPESTTNRLNDTTSNLTTLPTTLHPTSTSTIATMLPCCSATFMLPNSTSTTISSIKPSSTTIPTISSTTVNSTLTENIRVVSTTIALDSSTMSQTETLNTTITSNFKPSVTNVTENVQSTSVEVTTNSEIPTRKTSYPDFDFVVTDKETETPCLLAKMYIRIKVHYKKTDGTYGDTFIAVPKSANISGFCSEKNSKMELTWSELEGRSSNETNNSVNTIVLNFVNDGSKAFLDSISFHVFLDKLNFPDAALTTSSGYSVNGLGLFPTTINSGQFVCPGETEIHIGDTCLKITHIYLIAFNKDKDVSSKKEENCTSSIGVHKFIIISGVVGAVILVTLAGVCIWRKIKKPYTTSTLP